MIANINTKKLIELIKTEMKLRDTKIQALSEMIDSLEQKINYQIRSVDALSQTGKLSYSLPVKTVKNI